ncbi:ABC transporter permease [[Pseudopropionibacterium] massiliense]|uniref:ABC transporter permease n=2 Tax=Actinomycetes TaxID=1760 RepID=UPI0013EF1E77|nr:ABC transporter permease [[Pseudopropionibacterium] massiliense]
MSRVPRLMKAVAYKEWRGLLAKGLAGRLGFAFLFPAMMLGKAVSAAESSPAESVSWSLFAILFSAMVGMLSTTRFGEERGYGTLESFLGLPYGVRSLFLSKLLVPFLVSFGLGCIFAVFNLCWAHAQGFESNWVLSVVPAVLVFGWVLAVESAILVGYAMWMMSENAAKWAQMSVVGFYGGGMALPMLGGVAVSVSALVLVLALAAAVLGLLCFLALRKLSVERIVLNSG